MIDFSEEVGWPAEPTRVYPDSDSWLEPLRSEQDRKLAERRREVRREARRRWYAANAEAQREYAKAWRAANPERCAEYNRRRPRKTARRVTR